MDVLTAGMTVWCDVCVDIADVIERKVAALDLMRGQKYDGPYARKRVETVDAHFRMFSGVAYAEPFTSMRTTPNSTTRWAPSRVRRILRR